MTTLDIVRQHVGRRSRISAAEMHEILVSLAEHGLDLRNEYVSDTLPAIPWSHSITIDDYEAAQRAAMVDQTFRVRAATAWVRACRDITCISVNARGLRDGYVRYDLPGAMNPSQHAEVTFVPATSESVDYLRRHADRVLIVRDAEALSKREEQ